MSVPVNVGGAEQAWGVAGPTQLSVLAGICTRFDIEGDAPVVLVASLSQPIRISGWDFTEGNPITDRYFVLPAGNAIRIALNGSNGKRTSFLTIAGDGASADNKVSVAVEFGDLGEAIDPPSV